VSVTQPDVVDALGPSTSQGQGQRPRTRSRVVVYIPDFTRTPTTGADTAGGRCPFLECAGTETDFGPQDGANYIRHMQRHYVNVEYIAHSRICAGCSVFTTRPQGMKDHLKSTTASPLCRTRQPWTNAEVVNYQAISPQTHPAAQ